MQRMVLESAEEGRLKTQVEERREDIRRVREEKEEEWDKEQEKAQEVVRQRLKVLKADYQQQVDREETRLRKLYKEKAQDEIITLQQRQEEIIEKKLGYKRELRDRMLAQLANEKSRIELELQERVRDIKI